MAMHIWSWILEPGGCRYRAATLECWSGIAEVCWAPDRSDFAYLLVSRQNMLVAVLTPASQSCASVAETPPPISTGLGGGDHTWLQSVISNGEQMLWGGWGVKEETHGRSQGLRARNWERLLGTCSLPLLGFTWGSCTPHPLKTPPKTHRDEVAPPG